MPYSCRVYLKLNTPAMEGPVSAIAWLPLPAIEVGFPRTLIAAHRPEVEFTFFLRDGEIDSLGLVGEGG